MEIRIGTRGSELALWQANFAKEKLENIGITANIVVIKTKGDNIQDLSFDKMEGKGFFTKELEEALLNAEIDIAVHSMKDLPTEPNEMLKIGGISERFNAQDLLIIHKSSVYPGSPLSLRQGAKVGTSSNRRIKLLEYFDKSITTVMLRGNVPTRLSKLDGINYDAILLAAAGIERLNIDLSEYKVVELNPMEFVPAPAQGVLAYQIRKDNIKLNQIIKKISSNNSLITNQVERKLLQLINGGCQIPFGAYCYEDKMTNFHIHVAYSKTMDSPIRFYRLSQNTYINLAINMYEKIKKDVFDI